MPFGAHETMEVHEILNEKINMINHFSWYMQNCRDPQAAQYDRASYADARVVL